MKRRLVTFDWAMKKLLRSKANFGILEGFLSELLGRRIRILEILESETNKGRAAEKLSRLDLKVRDDAGEIFLIEVQYEREWDYLQRVFYTAAKTLTEHIDEGQPYGDIVKIISVNILYFDLGHGNDYLYHGKTVFRGVNTQEELQLSERQKKLFKRQFPGDLFPEFYLIKVNNFDDVARTPLDEWIYFLKHQEIKDSFKAQGLKQAKDRLDILCLSDRERRAYERFSDDLHYQASMVQSSYGDGKLDGLKEGMEKGLSQGREEGRQQGRQQGREEGRKEGQRQVARRLLAMGLSDDQVGEATGLSREDLEQLRHPHVGETPPRYRGKPSRSRKKKA